jgi:threonine aldolase
MIVEYLDFRSDTVTKPTGEMRRAMAAAEVGDDVYGDDPTVNELQEYAAGLTGMESAMYVCSGTMGNLVSLMSHCSRGDGVLMGTGSHTWKNEAGNAAFLAGVMPYPLDDSAGLPTEESIKSSYQPKGNVHYANTTLLTIENTHNSAGGLPADAENVARVTSLAHGMGLKVHMDGARIFDAVAFFGNDVRDYTRHVDSIQICLSKGLGAPMGSLVCGGRDFMDRARKYRKALGGGQRQIGIAAAAGLIALRDIPPDTPHEFSSGTPSSKLNDHVLAHVYNTSAPNNSGLARAALSNFSAAASISDLFIGFSVTFLFSPELLIPSVFPPPCARNPRPARDASPFLCAPPRRFRREARAVRIYLRRPPHPYI